MTELNILFSAEELFEHKKKPSQLPRSGGPKGFAPENSYEENVALACLYQEHKDVLQDQRVCKRGNLSFGTWNAERQVAEISVTKGSHWQYFGTKKHDTMLLQPEEALFLIEQGLLELYYGGLPMSFQQAYISFLSDAFPPEFYLVYAYFLRLGFTVLQHRTRNRETVDKTPVLADEKERKLDSDNKDGEDEHCRQEANVDDVKPSVPSALSHLWVGQGSCTPLLRPKDATSTAAVLSKLQVIKTQRMTEADTSQCSNQSIRVVFDVYQPGLNFKKTDPGTPDFCVSVCRFNDPPPSLASLTILRKECFPVPLKIALVDGGSVSFYSVLDVDSPTFISRG